MCNAQLTPGGVWEAILRLGDRARFKSAASRYADLSGSCSRPRSVTLQGSPWRSYQATDYFPGWGRERVGRVHSDFWTSKVWLDLDVRCRRCEACRRWRQKVWSDRAMSEARASHRVWMGTLTLKPFEVFQVKAKAEALAAQRALVWADLDEGAKFGLLQNVVGEIVTRWLKRLRKAGHRFRYVITIESHKSGVPHLHMLLHEIAAPIAKRVLHASWLLGFSKFKLIARGDESRAVRYVTKYVAKNSAARIRASIRYGVEPDRNGPVSPDRGPGLFEKTEEGLLERERPLVTHRNGCEKSTTRLDAEESIPFFAPVDQPRTAVRGPPGAERPKGSDDSSTRGAKKPSLPVSDCGARAHALPGLALCWIGET